MKRQPSARADSELTITVVPRSSRNRIELLANGGWRMHVTAPPVEGAANDALLKYLASLLAIPRSRLRIAAGQHSRHKRVQIEGIALDMVDERLRQELERQQ